MNIEKIRADISENYDSSLTIEIEGLDDKGRTVFTFQLGNYGTKKDWDNLLKACSNVIDYDYRDKKTGNAIYAYKDWVSFELTQNNDECYMALRVPNKMCVEAFQEILVNIK